MRSMRIIRLMIAAMCRSYIFHNKLKLVFMVLAGVCLVYYQKSLLDSSRASISVNRLWNMSQLMMQQQWLLHESEAEAIPLWMTDLDYDLFDGNSSNLRSPFARNFSVVNGSALKPDISEENLAVIGLRMEKLRENLKKQCITSKKTRCSWKENAYFNQNYFFRKNVTVCFISKGASSTWRHHLRFANRGPPFNMPIGLDPRRIAFLNRSLERVMEDIKLSTKIITVRHPLTRLVSVFMDKYENGVMQPYNPEKDKVLMERTMRGTWQDTFFQYWLPALKVNGLIPQDMHTTLGLTKPIRTSERYDISVYLKLYSIVQPKLTFSQFLKYAINTYRAYTPDIQWTQYYRCCCPCSYDYVYVTKVETLSEDLEYIFRKLGIESDPYIAKNKRVGTTDYLSYYDGVPLILKNALYTFIKDDMELFNYQLPWNYFL